MGLPHNSGARSRQTGSTSVALSARKLLGSKVQSSTCHVKYQKRYSQSSGFWPNDRSAGDSWAGTPAQTKSVLLGEGGAEEGEHAVAGDVAEGEEFEGVVAAVEGKGTGMAAMAAEGGEHLLGKLGKHGGVVLAVDHEAVAAGAHAALDVGHGADGSPEFAEVVDGDMVAEAFPDMRGRHALANHVGKVGGDVEESAGTDGGVVDKGDIADGGANAGADNAEAGVALLFEPTKAAAGVLDGLAVGLEG